MTVFGSWIMTLGFLLYIIVNGKEVFAREEVWK